MKYTIDDLAKEISAAKSKKIIPELLDKVKQNKLNISKPLKTGESFFSFLVPYVLDYNQFGHDKKSVKLILSKLDKNILIDEVLNNGSNTNPISICLKGRHSSVLFEEMLSWIDFNDKSVLKKNGVKLITSSYHLCDTNKYAHPSDFLCIVVDELIKTKDQKLIDHATKLCSAYIFKNTFQSTDNKNDRYDTNFNNSYAHLLKIAYENVDTLNRSDIEKMSKDLGFHIGELSVQVAYRFKDSILKDSKLNSFSIDDYFKKLQKNNIIKNDELLIDKDNTLGLFKSSLRFEEFSPYKFNKDNLNYQNTLNEVLRKITPGYFFKNSPGNKIEYTSMPSYMPPEKDLFDVDFDKFFKKIELSILNDLSEKTDQVKEIVSLLPGKINTINKDYVNFESVAVNLKNDAKLSIIESLKNLNDYPFENFSRNPHLAHMVNVLEDLTKLPIAKKLEKINDPKNDRTNKLIKKINKINMPLQNKDLIKKVKSLNDLFKNLEIIDRSEEIKELKENTLKINKFINKNYNKDNELNDKKDFSNLVKLKFDHIDILGNFRWLLCFDEAHFKNSKVKGNSNTSDGTHGIVDKYYYRLDLFKTFLTEISHQEIINKNVFSEKMQFIVNKIYNDKSFKEIESENKSLIDDIKKQINILNKSASLGLFTDFKDKPEILLEKSSKNIVKTKRLK